jgi:hypothetical protein
MFLEVQSIKNDIVIRDSYKALPLRVKDHKDSVTIELPNAVSSLAEPGSPVLPIVTLSYDVFRGPSLLPLSESPNDMLRKISFSMKKWS